MSRKRVIVTGGTGFVGANVVRRLLADGHEVHLLVRANHAAWRIESIIDSLRLHVVDLSDPTRLTEQIAAIQPDWAFHLAAYGAYSSQTDLDRMIQTNLIGTKNLVEACLRVGIEAFVNAGSSSEYGFKDHAPAEDEWVDPNSHYALTKVSATQYCRYTAKARGVPIITLRLYSVYGPYEEPTRLLPTLITRGMNGDLPPLVNPEIARDYVYVEDVSEAFIRAAASAATQSNQALGAVYNVGTGIQTTLREVVETARSMLPITDEPEWGSMPDRTWDTSVWVANRDRITEALGWQPRYRFADGFRAMVDWFHEHPPMRAHYLAHRELPT